MVAVHASARDGIRREAADDGIVLFLVGGGNLSPLSAAALNLFCGVFCGLYGIGALMAANIARSCADTHEARGTMSVVFITEALFRTALYIATGILTLPVLRRALLILPFALGGMGLGMRCVSRINERTAKLVVIGALILSGAALMLANL